MRGIYREHQQLGRDDIPSSKFELQQEQELRITKIINRWTNISRGVRCIVIGDINLNYLRWLHPEQDRNNFYRKLYSDIEEEHDSAKLYSTTKYLLGCSGGGPPNCFLIDGKTSRKQFDIAEILSKHYKDKVTKIKNSLPRVNGDPLKTLKKIFSKWRPSGSRPKFVLKSVTIVQVEYMIRKLKKQQSIWKRYS